MFPVKKKKKKKKIMYSVTVYNLLLLGSITSAGEFGESWKPI